MEERHCPATVRKVIYEQDNDEQVCLLARPSVCMGQVRTMVCVCVQHTVPCVNHIYPVGNISKAPRQMIRQQVESSHYEPTVKKYVSNIRLIVLFTAI